MLYADIISMGSCKKDGNSSALAMELRLSCTNPLILCMRPANERRRYIVTASLICWTHTLMIPVYATAMIGMIYFKFINASLDLNGFESCLIWRRDNDLTNFAC